MRSLFTTPALIAILSIGLHAAPAPDPHKQAQAILDKALKAHGGEERLAKASVVGLRTSGASYDEDEAISYDSEVSSEFPSKFRIVVRTLIGGDKNEFSRVINGEQGWATDNGKIRDMTKEEFAEIRESLYVANLKRLYPLRGEGFDVVALMDVKVGDLQTSVILVSAKNHDDVKLFFDQKTGLLIKSERVAADVSGMEHVTIETYFEDYKEVDGLKYASKVRQLRNGKKKSEEEVTEFRASEKGDGAQFTRPK
jgi:hypothetical protein